MCGIAGFVGAGTKAELEAMTSALVHRGPDDQGVFHHDKVGLGHRRLSIIDLSQTGHQPMFDREQTVGVVFNGEIYNFQSLREDLEKSGANFRGASDTEVIIELYKRDGADSFAKLNGMFAIALYDFKSGELYLLRDRMGKKPLYYFIDGQTLVFASEIKSLIKHHLFKAELDLESVGKFFSYDYIPTPKTIYKNVFKLTPATFAKFKGGKIKLEKFWLPNFESKKANFKDYLDEFDRVLSKAVESRLVADVPVGIWLSGGLDSSTAAYYAQKISKSPIRTFSIAFKEASFDESVYAREVAKYLKTEHTEFTITPKGLLNLLPRLEEIMDEPFADPSIIPTLALSELTKKQVTVVLGGDGSDELLAGYPTFQADKIYDLYKNIPKVLRENTIEKLVKLMPASDSNFSLAFKSRKFLDGVDASDLYRHHAWLSAFSKDDKALLFSPAVQNKIKDLEPWSDLNTYATEANTKDLNQTRLYLYERTYLMDGVLVKVDRASMQYGLEIRAPFLDKEVVEFLNRLPYHYKLRGFTTKYILKQLMSGKLPRHIINRSKKGFGIPLTKWLREDLKDWSESILNKRDIEQAGIFNYDYVSRLLKEHQAGIADHRKKLWAIITFEIWRKKWLAKV